MTITLHELNATLEQELELLWRFALRLTHQPERAEELVAETCLRVNEQRPQYADRRSFRCAVLGLEYRIWCDGFRSRLLRAVGSDSDCALSNSVHCYGSRLCDKFNRLPDAQRLAMLLVYVEEFTYHEAADILGLSINALMGRLAGARLSLGSQTPADQKRVASPVGLHAAWNAG